MAPLRLLSRLQGVQAPVHIYDRASSAGSSDFSCENIFVLPWWTEAQWKMALLRHARVWKVPFATTATLSETALLGDCLRTFAPETWNPSDPKTWGIHKRHVQVILAYVTDPRDLPSSRVRFSRGESISHSGARWVEIKRCNLGAIYAGLCEGKGWLAMRYWRPFRAAERRSRLMRIDLGRALPSREGMAKARDHREESRRKLEAGKTNGKAPNASPSQVQQQREADREVRRELKGPHSADFIRALREGERRHPCEDDPYPEIDHGANQGCPSAPTPRNSAVLLDIAEVASNCSRTPLPPVQAVSPQGDQRHHPSTESQPGLSLDPPPSQAWTKTARRSSSAPPAIRTAMQPASTAAISQADGAVVAQVDGARDSEGYSPVMPQRHTAC